jgi:hypothetical protein
MSPLDIAGGHYEIKLSIRQDEGDQRNSLQRKIARNQKYRKNETIPPINEKSFSTYRRNMSTGQ